MHNDSSIYNQAQELIWRAKRIQTTTKRIAKLTRELHYAQDKLLEQVRAAEYFAEPNIDNRINRSA